MTKESGSAQKDVKGAVHKRKESTLKSSSKIVKSKKQAIAIGLSKARANGKKVAAETKPPPGAPPQRAANALPIEIAAGAT